MPDTTTQTLTFRGFDGFAGFLHGKQYEVEVRKLDDGSGDVFVSMPHAPGKGPAQFTAQQWAEWWLGKTKA